MPRAMDSGGRFQHGSLRLLGKMPHPRDCQEVRCFDYFVVHHAVACQVREVRVLEESGVSPHPRAGRESAGDTERLASAHRRLCARAALLEPRSADEHDERWTQLMQCTEREILGGCDILGDEARAYMGRGLAPRWVIRKVAPAKSYNRPRMARDTRWWRVLSNRLRELWLMEALPTRRPHLPQQPGQIERLRGQLLRMANEAPVEKDRAEIWEMATQEYGEPELQVLKDVHWRALTVLDKLHKRDRRVREKSIAEYAREASKGAAGLLHRLTKPRPVWCPRDAAQGEVTNPRDAAELAANSWSRIWRVHIEELQNADRPWETPNGQDMSALPQLEVEGPSWSRISVKGKQLYTDLLNDVERTLTWPAQIQTLIYFLVPKTPTGVRPIGLMPSIVRVWERMRKPILDQWMISQTRSYDWACKGRSAEMAAWQHLVLEEDKPGMGRATALLDMTKCFEQVRLWHEWRWGCHWGFPRALLRIILLVFSFQRRVGLWGSVSQPVTTYAAIIAGSVFSCAILHMLFIWPCDCLMSKWPRLRLTKYVDDLTISYRGKNHIVANVITEALCSLVGWLENGLDFLPCVKG